ncbi:MAG TPA: hypothetical protein PKW44_00780 [Methylophilaceae bacterium]|nr:hypothetical protein [Methylophilaceae bacterium]HQR60507.1 hypothetical protein [Methylophilaceae bacterium]
MKIRTIRNQNEVDELVATIARSTEYARTQLARIAAENDGLQALWSIKFSPMGCNPLDFGSPLNLIEQVNQTFTYLASAKAVQLLLELHPQHAPFTVNLGTSPGSDIESENGTLAAEVFAAVNTSNNKKLAKDRAKVSKTNAQLKYVFFMCPDYEAGRQQNLEREAGVMVWSLGTAP